MKRSLAKFAPTIYNRDMKWFLLGALCLVPNAWAEEPEMQNYWDKKPKQEIVNPEEPQAEKPIRRPPASQRVQLKPPVEEVAKEEPQPEMTKAIRYQDVSPVVFAQEMIVVQPWLKEENSFDSEPRRWKHFRATLRRGDMLPKNDTRMTQAFAEGEGMLTLYPEDLLAQIDLSKALVSYDIAWLDADGKILNIVQDTQFNEIKSLASPIPVRSFLQVSGGALKAQNIKVGDRVRMVAK